MDKLTDKEILYLLYADAYSEEGSVTKGNITSRFSVAMKQEAEAICNKLIELKLLLNPKTGRVSLTEAGRATLIENLCALDHKLFDSVKGPKVLNTLLGYFKNLSDKSQKSKTTEELGFEAFLEIFKPLYFKIRNEMNLSGVTIIRKREIYKLLNEKQPCSEAAFDEYLNILRDEGQISLMEGRQDLIIEWVGID